ncbi:serine/threonine protein kinase [Paenibacillus sp. CAA11]|uniref:serine/threonine protein kinase n=1 Tax=Paenibacillus sp. CAA11 TaxID=1532905 RepID=UPI001F220AD7|nr:serine/threonine protein kinase [Paenibacillus sp. CAA11]
MNTSTDFVLEPGTLITGRWRGGKYKVKRLLGQGANGVVYLVQTPGRPESYALKMGYDTIDLQSEINVLKALQFQSHGRGIPSASSYLVEVDDYRMKDQKIPFYVMRYIKGEPLSFFVARKGADWLGLAGLSLLRQLRKLHESGWVFGDLKPENVLVSPYGEAELIDYGGVSLIGRSVKQFTEWYDRGFWNAGSRSADEAYDWFAFSVVCIHLLAGSELKAAARGLPQVRSVQDLLAIVDKVPRLAPYAGWLKSGLTGKFSTTTEACLRWEQTIRKPSVRKTLATPRWLSRAFILSLVLLGCALYWHIRYLL